jgi:superfamily I DNA and/or RNA helicase
MDGRKGDLLHKIKNISGGSKRYKNRIESTQPRVTEKQLLRNIRSHVGRQELNKKKLLNRHRIQRLISMSRYQVVSLKKFGELFHLG